MTPAANDPSLPGAPSTPAAMLATAIDRGRLPHALLFLGESDDREEAARSVARGLLCDRPRAGAGCGECGACRRVSSGAHPDVHWVAPEAELVARGLAAPDAGRRPSRDVRVEQVRDLAREMRMRPYEGRARVAIVVDAHRMTPGASNALLKTLEEPGPSSVLILLAPHERAVLPTIASRAARVRFRPSAIAARATDETTREAAETLLHAMSEPSPTARLAAIEGLGRDRESALAALDAAAAQIVRATRDRLAATTVDAGAADDVRTMRWLDAIAKTREAIVANAHVQIALEELLLLEGR